MTIADIVALVSPDSREAVRIELAKLEGGVKITSREEAAKLFESNQWVKDEFQANLSRKNADYDAKFNAEKLPGIVQAKVAEEIAKTAPKLKDPAYALLEERIATVEKAKAEAEAALAKQSMLARVAPKLAELGLSTKWADRLLASTEQETDDLAAAFVAEIDGMRKSHAEKLLKDKFGTQVPPSRGTVEPLDLKARYDKAMAEGNADLALALQSKMQLALGK
jgi:hypothetical protein